MSTQATELLLRLTERARSTGGVRNDREVSPTDGNQPFAPDRPAVGDHADFQQLARIVYEDLRRLAYTYMAQEQPGHTLQPTALLHEAFLKLVDQTRVDWRGRSHFFSVGAQAMRRILVNHAKSKGRIKRGGGQHKIPLDDVATFSIDRDEDVLALDVAIEKLEALDPRQAKIIELRFFGGLDMEATAEAMGISKRTVEREWTACRAWLRRELSERT
jgi:RNA polymerase sigma-70 factor (ECF subfamily)